MSLFFELLLDFVVDLFLPKSKKEERKEKRAQKRGQRANLNQRGQRSQDGQRGDRSQRHQQQGGKPGLGGAASFGTSASLPGHDAYFLPEGAAMPHLEYRPNRDGGADPGEVVWAWVPFEDDPSVGKDRPVLVLAEHRDGFVCAQMTSKDHEDFKETQWGRRWMDIGTGDWDRQHRPSEVRLDRFVFIPAHSVRREGGRVSEAVYSKVVKAIQAGRYQS
ncbi:MAG: type II toxin-antitoxin system PemK/MazF family toxin [Actinomycetaceae bacterium]|nr:type II toxin-antitoxin system PemK/MazF family toxin [Actinomycetaceae bacterium]